jgi:acylphosphatase
VQLRPIRPELSPVAALDLARQVEAGDARYGEPIRKRAIIYGRVQGVFFRDTTRREASSRGVAGWVRNRPDGTVEAVFEGDPDAVEAMVAFCRAGPRGAQVERVEVSGEEEEGLAGFEVR